jgi:hypothetical protein
MSRFVAPIRFAPTAKGGHYRDANGTRVPGITTFIGDGVPKPALINWAGNATAEYAVDHWDELAAMPPAARLKRLQGARYAERDHAKDRGTEVHRAAELLVAGKSAQIPEDIAGHVESYARFLDEFAVEAVHVEFSAVSYRWGYAGRGDLVGWVELPEHGRALLLLELKTSRSGIFGETALQLAALRYADAWIVDGQEQAPDEVAFCGGIHVRADGCDLMPVEAGEAEHREFLYAMKVGQFVARSRDLVGPPIVAPTTSTFRLTREPAR